MEHAPELAKQARAQVIVIDWGSSDLSCCSYPLLVFCHMKKISEWMANAMKMCSTIGSSTSISNTWLIGHSLGAQFVGYTAESLFKSGLIVNRLIGLDPSGPLFNKYFVRGKCHGIQLGHANQTMIFYTNPGGLGAEFQSDSVDIRVLCNSEKEFCQHGCDCNNLICNHIYATATLFTALVKRHRLEATYLDDTKNAVEQVSLYDKMRSGLYDLDSNRNPTLQKEMKKHSSDEL